MKNEAPQKIIPMMKKASIISPKVISPIGLSILNYSTTLRALGKALFGLGLLGTMAHAACDPTLQPTFTTRAGMAIQPINSCSWGDRLNTNFSILDSSMCLQGSTNTYTSYNEFANKLFIDGIGNSLQPELEFLARLATPVNGGGRVFLYNGTDNASQLGITAQDGVIVNGALDNGLIDLFSLGIFPGAFQTQGSFAVMSSSANGSQAYSGLTAISPIDHSTLWSLPSKDGTNGQLLGTDGATHLGWYNGGGGGGGGSATIAFNQNGIQITSPTIAVNALSPPFLLMAVGGATTTQWKLDGSSVTLEGPLLTQGNAWTGFNNHTGSTTYSGNINISSGVLILNSPGTNGQILTSGGSGAVPSWQTTPAPTLQNTGVAFGSAGNVVTSDTNSFTYTAGTKLLTVSSISVSNFNLTGSGNASITENGQTGQIIITTDAAKIVAGHFAQFGSSAMIVDGGTGAGGGTPGGSSGQVQYNNTGSFAGSNNFQFNGTSITVSGSSITISNQQGGTNAGGIGGTGLVDIYQQPVLSTNQTLFAVGSQNLHDQVTIRDNASMLIQRGITTANMTFDLTTSSHMIVDRSQSNNSINLYNNGDMEFKTNTNVAGSDMIFYPELVNTVIMSSVTGFTVTRASTNINGVNMVWPSSGTIGNVLSYTSTNTLQWVAQSAGGGGGSTVLQSSGIAFGSASNTVTQDTNSLIWNESTQNLVLTSTQSVGVFSDPNTITLKRATLTNNCIGFNDAGFVSPMALCGNGTTLTLGSQNNTGGFNAGTLVVDANNSGSSTATINSNLVRLVGPLTDTSVSQSTFSGGLTASTVNIVQNGTTVPASFINTPLDIAVSTNAIAGTNFINRSTGTSAAGYLQVTSALGGQSTYYVTMGIVSPNYNAAGFSIVPGSAAFLYSSDSNMEIGSAVNGTQGDIVFGTNLPISSNRRMTISSTGTITTLSNMNVSSGVYLNGNAGTNGQVYTSGGAGSIPSWSTQTDNTGYALQPATVTIQANQGISVSSGITASLPANLVTATSTLTSTMSVVEASVPIVAAGAANASFITLTLPYSSSTLGSDMMIYKVDSSTGEVRIVPQINDNIEGGTTVFLDAPTQHASLHATHGGWASGIGGIQYTPPYLYANPGGDASTPGVASASMTVICPFYNPVPVIVTGFRFVMQATGGTGTATYSLGIYDKNGNLVVSSNTILTTATGVQTRTIPNAILPPGAYYQALQMSNTLTTINGDSAGSAGHILCSQQTGSTGSLPNPFTFGTLAVKTFSIDILVNGGRTSE